MRWLAAVVWLTSTAQCTGFGGPRRSGWATRRPRVIVSGGSGEVKGRYSWTENDDELEVRVAVPAGTKAGEVQFELTQKRLLLKLASENDPLLDGELRGKVTTDGSYWSIESAADTAAGSSRMVVLRLEKKPDGMYDPEEWQGVLLDACERDATIHYDLDEREEFNVEDYIESLGGYDESLVDKTMFSGVAKDLLDNMVEHGLVQDTISRDDDDDDDGSDGDVQEAEVVEKEERGTSELAAMTVKELKAELRDRGLPTSGLKAVLVGRLSAALGDSRAQAEEEAQQQNVKFE